MLWSYSPSSFHPSPTATETCLLPTIFHLYHSCVVPLCLVRLFCTNVVVDNFSSKNNLTVDTLLKNLVLLPLELINYLYLPREGRAFWTLPHHCWDVNWLDLILAATTAMSAWGQQLCCAQKKAFYNSSWPLWMGDINVLIATDFLILWIRWNFSKIENNWYMTFLTK